MGRADRCAYPARILETQDLVFSPFADGLDVGPRDLNKEDEDEARELSARVHTVLLGIL